MLLLSLLMNTYIANEFFFIALVFYVAIGHGNRNHETSCGIPIVSGLCSIIVIERVGNILIFGDLLFAIGSRSAIAVCSGQKITRRSRNSVILLAMTK